MNPILKFATLAAAMIFLTGLTAPDGEPISRGEPADELLTHLGYPMTRMLVSVNPDRVEVWTYRIKGITYRFTLENGVIAKEDWKR